MRHIRTCLLLILGPAMMGSAMMAGQQAQPATTQKPAQNVATKQSGNQDSHPATTKHATTRAKRKNSKVSARKGAKRPEYRREYSENSVQVINGDATKKVVFQGEQAPASEKNGPKSMKDVPAPLKVEVLNGPSTDTQYFYGNGQDQEIARNQQVVVGVESSNTRTIGGNQHPVVTSVNSAENEDARPASGEQPVTNSVSPRPKRQAYQPDVH